MVKHKTKVVTIVASFIVSSLPLFSTLEPASAVEGNTNFHVDVGEVLSVSLTTPTVWASGNVDTFLRNTVTLNVATNNANGFTASMTTKTNNTSLVNTSKTNYTLPTLAANTTRTNFPANYWGYSLDDTTEGNGSSTYSALVGAGSTPITILSSNSASSGSKVFYFGAKANVTQASGTYSGTVVVSVVTGVIDDNTNPITPTNPDTPNPAPSGSSGNTPTYNSTRNTTTYTTRTTGVNNETTTTEISTGDNRGAYGNVNPLGVTYSTSSNVSTLPELTTGLAIASSVAASSGLFFLFAARREEDDDDENPNS